MASMRDLSQQILGQTLMNKSTQDYRMTPGGPVREESGDWMSDFYDWNQGWAEAGRTIGSGLLGSVPAGWAGLGELAMTGDPAAAAQRVQDVQQALTYVPRSEQGMQALSDTGAVLAPLAAPAQAIGQTTLDITGSPAAATAAEIGLDPLNYIPGVKGLAAMAPLIKRAGKGKPTPPGTGIAETAETADIGQPPTTLMTGDEVFDAPIVESTVVGSSAPIRFDETIREQSLSKVKEIAATKGNKKPKVEDLVDFFEADHLERYGRQLDPNDPTDFNTAIDAAADEIGYQLKQSESGAGWYDGDVKKTFDLMGTIPQLKSVLDNETDRVIWTAIAGPTSIGNNVNMNTKASIAAMLLYKKTGKIPTVPPKAGATTEGLQRAGWGAKQKAVAAGMKVIDKLITDLGKEGFADWWLSPHTLGELTAVRKAAGLSGGPSGLSGGKDSMHLGAMILGDKTGKYSLNLNGYEGPTKDVWFTRSYNRHFGNMKDKKGLPMGGPRSATERRRMEEFTASMKERLEDTGLSEQDIQAVLWFYEQNLFTDLGVLSRPGSFSKGMEAVNEQLGIRQAIRGGDGIETTAEPGATLSGFRGVSPRQRTVRAQRRLQARDGAIDSDEARGYSRRSDGLPRGVRLLEPSSEMVARYEAANLKAPVFSPADSPVDHRAQMVASLRGNKFAPQVDIKSVDDLANMELFQSGNGAGFAIDNGDVVAVYGSPQSKGSAYAMIQAAIEAGGTKLDAFDTYLPDIYETVGFRPVARIKWDESQKPDGWDKKVFEKFNNGEPDVVWFAYDPKYYGEAVDAPYVDSWDEGVSIQSAKVREYQKE